MRWTLSRFWAEGVRYSSGIPDFSPFAAHTLRIEDMSRDRYRNFQKCDSACAEEWNRQAREDRTDWTARDIAQWRSEHGYTWHERNDMHTCDLVPTAINDYFRHLGGVAECVRRDSAGQEVRFDA